LHVQARFKKDQSLLETATLQCQESVMKTVMLEDDGSPTMRHQAVSMGINNLPDCLQAVQTRVHQIRETGESLRELSSRMSTPSISCSKCRT